MPVIKSRWWVFTVFCDNMGYGELVDHLENHVDYYLFSVELCPLTQKFHFQGMMYVKARPTFRQVKEWLGDTTHCEVMKGTIETNQAYCSKAESHVAGPFEYGAYGSQLKSTQMSLWVSDVKLGIRQHDLIEKYPGLYLSHFKNLSGIYNELMPRTLMRAITVRVFYGPTRTGKTTRAYTEGGGLELWKLPVQVNKSLWFDSYSGQKKVLMDEFSGQIEFPTLFRLLDKWPELVPFKGGYVNFEPTDIWITSNYNPNEWYPDIPQRSKDAMWARFTEVLDFQFDPPKRVYQFTHLADQNLVPPFYRPPSPGNLPIEFGPEEHQVALGFGDEAKYAQFFDENSIDLESTTPNFDLNFGKFI